MAYEILMTNPYSLPASADLSASQYRFLAMSGGNVAAAGAGVASVGVLQNQPSAEGQPAAILALGISKVVAGAAIGAGVKVMTDAQGRAIAATGTNFVVGIALEAAAAAGQVIPVLVIPLGHNALA